MLDRCITVDGLHVMIDCEHLMVESHCHGMQAHSLPVSIPQQMLGKGGFKDSAVKADTFVPPHQLSLHSSHIQQSVPLSSSSRLRTRNKLLQSTGFLPSACTEGFIVSGQSGDSLSRTQSDGRMLRSMPAESELLEAQSEPLLPITNSSNASNIQFLRSASKVSIPASIAEILG